MCLCCVKMLRESHRVRPTQAGGMPSGIAFNKREGTADVFACVFWFRVVRSSLCL
jgi:hypothetical protein